MSTENTTTNGAAAPAQPVPMSDLPSMDQRVTALHEQFRAEQSEPADPTAPTEPAPKAEEPAKAAAAPTPEAAARRARLDELQAKERAKVDRKNLQAASDKTTRELQVAQQRIEEAEARAAARIDRADLKDPVRVMRIMEEEGVPAARVAEAIREAMANPEKAAEIAATNAARKALDPEVKALRDKLAALEAREAERAAAYQNHQKQQAETHALTEFCQFTETASTTAPYAAAFLKSYGSGEFHKLAVQAAQQVPEGAGWQPVLDVIEEQLTGLAPIFSTTASNAKAPPPTRTGAAKPTTTLSNSLAQERASVAQADDWSSLPFDERVARLKDSRR